MGLFSLLQRLRVSDSNSLSQEKGVAAARPFSPHDANNTSFNIVITGSYSAEKMKNIAASPEALQNAFYAISGRTDVKIDSVQWVSYFR